MAGKIETHVSEEKKKIVSGLEKLIKSKKTILITSIKNIPASQFQIISKKLRGKAIVKVPKKNLIFRAIDNSGNEAVKQLKEKINEDVALLFSDIDAFELAGELVRNKNPAKAKAGQEAPEDIVIEAGPTELLPGPAISELGAIGLRVQIENGKITIKEPRVVAKKGEVISSRVADVMSKLDIKPFLIGFIPLAAFDNEKRKIYTNIIIDSEGTIKELKTAFGKALGFAVAIGYASKDTIGFLIGKAGMQARALEKFAGVESEEEENAEDGTSEIKEDDNEENVGEGSEGESTSEEKIGENPEPSNENQIQEVQTPEDKTEGEENK